MASLGLVIFFLILGIGLSSGAKILIVNPYYSGSPLLTLLSIAESLAERGHQIDIIKWKDLHEYPINHHPNITYTTLSMDNSNGEWALLTKEKHAAFEYPHDKLTKPQGVSRIPSLKAVSLGFEILQLFKYQCDTLLGNMTLFRQLQNANYDIAIAELIINECGMALIHQLKIPVIGFWVPSFASVQPDCTTAFLPASHVPAMYSKFGHRMDFFDRTVNFGMKIVGQLAASLLFFVINRSVQNYYPGTPQISDLFLNINGMLINSDPSVEYPRLLPPTFINVGGLQIRPLKLLPKDIEDWIESSGDHGVVLVAMGVTHDFNLVTKEVQGYFMEVFSKFPQKFLVKFEGKIDHVPINVKLSKWIPQQDVLGHPKTKAFITHCGVHGALEAVYYSVPMICMPLGVDHGDMFTRVKEKDIALGLDKNTVTKDDIFQQLNEILYNSKYRNNIKKVSRIMRDTKETPRERAIEFIEYMIRHKGAEHLLLSSRYLNWIQFYSLDSIAFLLFIALFLVYTSYTIMKHATRILKSLVYKKTKKID